MGWHILLLCTYSLNLPFIGVMSGCVLMLGMRWLAIFDLGNERIFVRKSARLFFAINQRVILHNFEDAAAGLYQLNF